MPYADLIILAIILFFFIKGWIKGFFLEFFTFVGLIVAAFASVALYKALAPVVSEFTGISENLAKGILFIVGFVAVSFFFGAIGRYLNKKTEALELNHINRTLGALFGAGQGLLISGILMLILFRHPLASGLGNTVKKGSYFAGYVLEFIDWVLKTVENLF